MALRMTPAYREEYKMLLELRKSRREDFMGDDLGTFYRSQRLLYMLYNREITKENLPYWLDKKKLSEDVVPVEWYHSEDVDVQKIKVRMQKNYMKQSRKQNFLRGRVTPLRLKAMLYDILMQRIDRYENPEKYMEKKKIFCIIGESGAGKTLASLHLKNKLGANVICSYTTRPPRNTEVEGREHHFINIVPDPNELLAYTNFAGFEYYALKTQVSGPCTVYVIDEDGLKNLKSEHGEEYDIYAAYVTRQWKNRVKSDVDRCRMGRDKGRSELPAEMYDWIVNNDSTKRDFFIQIENIYNEIISK